MKISLFSFGQGNLGIAGSNYAGTNGVFLNPSSIVDSKVYIDINVIGSGAYIWNNYVYLHKNDFSFYQLITGKQGDVELQDRFIPTPKNAFISAFGHGPSATFHIKGLHAIGFHTKVRSYTELRGVPFHMAKFGFEGVSAYTPQHEIYFKGENFRMRNFSWAEFGLTYAGIVHRFMDKTVSVGVSLKKLVGLNYHGFNMNDFNYFVVDTNDLEVFNFSGNYSLAQGWNSGKGWSLDLGVTIKKMYRDATAYVPFSKNEDCQNANYVYKLALSLIDMGSINFTKNAHFREYAFARGFWEDYNDIDVSSANSLNQNIVNQLENFSATSSLDQFKAKLPTALSVQYDYHILPYIYLNSTLIQGFPRNKSNGVYRPSLLTFTPRFETRYFEFAMPFGLFDYRLPQLGMMFRFNSIIIGSDKIGAMLFRQNVYGADIYFNLKYSIYRSSKCGKRRGNSKDKEYVCPVFK